MFKYFYCNAHAKAPLKKKAKHGCLFCYIVICFTVLCSLFSCISRNASNTKTKIRSGIKVNEKYISLLACSNPCLGDRPDTAIKNAKRNTRFILISYLESKIKSAMILCSDKTTSSISGNYDELIIKDFSKRCSISGKIKWGSPTSKRLNKKYIVTYIKIEADRKYLNLLFTLTLRSVLKISQNDFKKQKDKDIIKKYLKCLNVKVKF